MSINIIFTFVRNAWRWETRISWFTNRVFIATCRDGRAASDPAMNNAASTDGVNSGADGWFRRPPSLPPSSAACRRRGRYPLPPRFLFPAQGAVVGRSTRRQHHLQQDTWPVATTEDALSGPSGRDGGCWRRSQDGVGRVSTSVP